MGFVNIRHMNGGEGDTSYAKNSILQRKIISLGKPHMKEAIADIFRSSTESPASMGIADLGCASGPNTLTLISDVIDLVNSRCNQMNIPAPELRVCLNDLPANDFNAISMSLPSFYRKQEMKNGEEFRKNCYVSCVPGSFHGRLFPNRSLHFVHSANSLHWLSQSPPSLNDVNASGPLNKGKIYISKTSPGSVTNAYLQQFQNDFSSFLKSRSEEVVPGGRMVLSFVGRMAADPTTDDSVGSHKWELLAQALQSMAWQGRVPEDKIDFFNAPFYVPSMEEVRYVIETLEGSFIINSLEPFEVNWDPGFDENDEDDLKNNNVRTTTTSGRRVAKLIRAAIESMLESQFGTEIMDDLFVEFGQLVDDLFVRFGQLVDDYTLTVPEPNYIILVVSVSRKYDPQE